MPLPMGSTPFSEADLKAIGEVIVAGAALEWMFDFCIWTLVQSQFDIGISITAGLRTSSKIQMLGTLGRIRLQGSELEEFKHALGRARPLLRERDLVVHGSGWDFGDSEDSVRYFRAQANKGVEYKTIEISKSRIAGLSSELGDTRTRLNNSLEPFRIRVRDQRRAASGS